MPDPDLPAFRIDRTSTDGEAVLRLAGELDLLTADDLSAAVDESRSSGAERLVIDLEGLTFIDSSGLRSLLAVHAASRADGFSLSLRQGGEKVRRVFELAGLVDTLPFEG